LGFLTQAILTGDFFFSADLWVAGSVIDSKDTGFTASINYAVNSVEGENRLISGWIATHPSFVGAVKTTRLVFADHTIEDQAFCELQ